MRLTADPPTNLSWSGGYYGDEAGYAHNARNKVLFGKWMLDEYNPVYVNPILTFFDYLSFRIFAPSIFSLRLVALFWGVLGIFFIFFILKYGCDASWMPWAGLLLLETNDFFLMYTRLSLSDTMLTNWMLFSVFLWTLGLKKRFFMFFAGLSSMVVMSCKPTAVYFSFVLFLASLFHFTKEVQASAPGVSVERRPIVKEIFLRISPFVVGVLTGGFLWLGLYFLPHHAEFAKMSSGWSLLSLPKSLREFLSREFGSYAPIVFKHFARFPYSFLLAWCYLPVSGYRILKKDRHVRSLEFLALFWFLLGYISLSGFRYRPPRYYLSLVPPVMILALFSMEALLNASWNSLKRNKMFVLGYIGWVILTFHLAKKYILLDSSYIFISGFVVSGIILGGMKIFHGKISSEKRLFRKAGLYIAVLIFSLSLTHNLFLYMKWAKRPSYQVLTASREVGKMVKNGIIVGLWAPMICMENRNRALCVASHWFNDKEPYKTYHFTHVFLWRGNHDAELSLIRRPLGRNFIKEHLKPVAKFKIKGAWGILFKVVQKKEARK